MPSSNSNGSRAPGGAPRAVLRLRTGSNSTSSLRRVGVKTGATANMLSQSRNADERRETPAVRSSSGTPLRLATPMRSSTPARSVAPDISPTERSTPPAVQKRSAAGSAPNVAKVAEEDEGVMGGRLNADGAVLPPWSCILNSKIRYQPTTLVWKIHEVPKGMDRAVKALDARRYQPTSADLGLAFRLRDAKPGGSIATLERICCDKTVPVREGVPTPTVHKFQHPSWWGCGPKDSEAFKLSSTYEDLGENWQEQGIGKELTHSISTPLLDGRFTHQNPFMAQFAGRTDGGCIVYDVSVNGKAGCCARDPKCPRPKKRGW